MHQAGYIDGMVERYECTEEFDALILLPPSVLFACNGLQMGELLPKGNLYSRMVDSLSHLSQCTRPDSLYAAGVLSRYLKFPRAAHRGAAVHHLRYVKGAKHKKFAYGI